VISEDERPLQSDKLGG